jgi:hypothetical protein
MLHRIAAGIAIGFLILVYPLLGLLLLLVWFAIGIARDDK